MLNDEYNFDPVSKQTKSNAAGWAKTADFVFTFAERCRVVGALTYAESAVKQGSSAWTAIALLVSALQILLIVWAVTQITSVVAPGIEWALNKVAPRARVRQGSLVSTLITIAVVGAFSLWINGKLAGLVRAVAQILASKAGH